ncbi:hypothetical protein FACS1894153_3340 [Bacteroidia bacterium]|nr:hypothetical protein FACS1894153_3340 [Bacteroidia bacterium]
MFCQAKRVNNVVLTDFTKDFISMYVNEVVNLNAKNKENEIIIVSFADTSYYYLSVFANNSEEYNFCRDDFIGQTLYLGHTIRIFCEEIPIFYSVKEKIKRQKRCDDDFTEYDPTVWRVCLYKDLSFCKKKTYKVTDYEDISTIQSLVEKHFSVSNTKENER